MILTSKVYGINEAVDGQVEILLRVDEKPGSIDFRFLKFKIPVGEASTYSIGRKVKITIEPK